MSSKELVISSNRHETKVAILEDDQLVEIYFQRANEYSLAGSIHKGRVTRVLPGMQSAFVDLGLERDTFLYVSDFFDENDEEYEKIPASGEDKGNQQRSRSPRPEPIEPPAAAAPRQLPTSPLPDAETNPEPAETVAPITLDGPSAIPSERPNMAGQDNRGGDRRGRRSRRRRTRGGGFPESKYANDVLAEDEPDDAPASSNADEPDAPAAEVFLLPGESLAKYSTRGTVEPVIADAIIESESRSAPSFATHDEDPGTAAEESNGDVSAGATAVAGDVRADRSTEGPAEIAADVAEAEEQDTAAALNEERLEAGQMPEPGEFIGTAFPDPSYISPGLAVPRAEFEEPPASSGSAAEPGVDPADIALVGESQRVELEGEIEPVAAVEADAAPVEGDSAESDIAEATGPAAEEGDAVADPSESAGENSEPLTASVREQGARYPHRGSRRMRRRRGGEGRGGDSQRAGDAQQRPATDIVAPVAEAAAPEPKVTRDREPRAGNNDRDRSSDRERSADKDRGDRPPLPSITDLLKEGQEIIVQIAKEPLGQKGARITSHIALPGRYVVYMPTVEHLGVSRKIASDEERQRLKRILQTHRLGISGGFIVRTAGEGHTEDEIASDMAYLYNLWLDIRSKSEKKPAPLLLHHDLDIVQRILRDQLSDMFKTIWVDSEELYESILRFMQRFQPSLVSRVKLYTRPMPIFDSFNVSQEIEKALRPKVWLKSGGYIVVNQTEALVAIDVNTGKYVGKSNRLEDTITKTNTEAVKEIVRQIRLRDLGGIIVVDFIDMDERKNRQKVMQTLEEAMRADRAPYKILQFNDFGLVAITRKRVKQSLERTLCSPCPTCEGAAYVKSVMTVVSEILQEAAKLRPMVDGKNVVLRTHPEVGKFLKSSRNAYLEEIEEILGRPVLVTSDPLLHPEKFDLAW